MCSVESSSNCVTFSVLSSLETTNGVSARDHRQLLHQALMRLTGKKVEGEIKKMALADSTCPLTERT